VIIETIKTAEDGQGMILRLYESQRKRCPIKLEFFKQVESACLVNLLEEDPIPLEVDQSRVFLDMKPYQIASLKVQFKARD
jgi:alpha-mannosidase